MRRTIRTVVSLAAAAGVTALVGLQAQPAYAEDFTGLTFYEGTFGAPVLHLPAPDGQCKLFPPTAGSLAAAGTVTQVHAYQSTDCTGVAWGLGTLRTFQPGRWSSFLAS